MNQGKLNCAARIPTWAIGLLFCMVAVVGHAEELYRIELMRAAPGELLRVIDDLRAAKPASADQEGPFVLRHSQGDHWDLMRVTPIGSYTSYFAADAIAKHEKKQQALRLSLAKHLAWREDVFMFGPQRSVFAQRFAAAGFFHIEMFKSLAGRRDALLNQRAMENNYLERIGRQQNLIFRRDLGAAWDVMTIGFYKNLQDFASSGDISPEAENQAAKAAGFKAANRIGSFLRTLIDRHNDTLAVRAF